MNDYEKARRKLQKLLKRRLRNPRSLDECAMACTYLHESIVALLVKSECKLSPEYLNMLALAIQDGIRLGYLGGVEHGRLGINPERYGSP